MKEIKHEVLILGMGNLFMSDDGAGIHVVERLQQKEWPSDILIMEVGTSAVCYLEEISTSRQIIAIDAVRTGAKPGTIYRLTLEDITLFSDGWRDSHGFSFPHLIELARRITGFPTNVTIYGVEPLRLNFGNRLSGEVKNSLPRLTNEISKEIDELLGRFCDKINC